MSLSKIFSSLVFLRSNIRILFKISSGLNWKSETRASEFAVAIFCYFNLFLSCGSNGFSLFLFGGIIFVIRILSATLFNSFTFPATLSLRWIGTIFFSRIYWRVLFNYFTFRASLSLGCCGTIFTKEISLFNSFTFLLSLSRRCCELL